MEDIDTFGFELLQQLYDSNITKKEDVIILFVHWFLVKHGLRCLGSGDSRAFDGSEEGKEILPEDWNTRPSYALRYVHNSKLYILHATRSDEDFLLNLLGIENNAVASTQFPINQTVNELHGPLKTLIPSYQTLIQNVKKELFEPIIPTQTTKEQSVQTSSDANLSSTKIEGPKPGTSVDPLQTLTHHPDRRLIDPLSSIGSADLNPFAAGGGMIFNPFDHRGLQPPRPRGGGRDPLGLWRTDVGARFDPPLPPPFGTYRIMPDHDHFVPPRMGPNRDASPPPDGSDDMFC